MTKFQWLSDYQELQYDIATIELNLERSKGELKRWESGDLANVKLEKNSRASNLEDIIFNLEYELAHKINDLFNIKQLVEKFEGLEHQILIKKYIEGKSLECAAEELNYSYTYIKQRHAALRRTMRVVEKVL